MNTPQILGINHLGLVPRDQAQANFFFVETLGLDLEGVEEVASQKTQVSFLSSQHPNSPKTSHQPRLEFLQPTAPSSPIQSYLDKFGGGVHHIAFQVASVEEMHQFLQAKGISLINSTPVEGAHQTLVFFVHPKSTGGFLVEFCQQA